MYSSTSLVSLKIVQRHSTAESKDDSTLREAKTQSINGVLTTSATEISRNQELMHSRRCGLVAAASVEMG